MLDNSVASHAGESCADSQSVQLLGLPCADSQSVQLLGTRESDWRANACIFGYVQCLVPLVGTDLDFDVHWIRPPVDWGGG